MFKPTANGLRRAGPRKRVDNREERIAVTKSATVCIDGASQSLHCTLRDVNSGGARLSGTNLTSIPDVFLLICRAENLVARARIAWRKPTEIGVAFLRRGTMDHEESYRREQVASYAKDQEVLAQQRAAQAAAAQQAQFELQQQAQLAAQEYARQVAVMGLDPKMPVTAESLKSAYRKKAMTCHPDQGGSMEEFQMLNNAYNYISACIASHQAQMQAAV